MIRVKFNVEGSFRLDIAMNQAVSPHLCDILVLGIEKALKESLGAALSDLEIDPAVAATHDG